MRFSAVVLLLLSRLLSFPSATYMVKGLPLVRHTVLEVVLVVLLCTSKRARLSFLPPIFSSWTFGTLLFDMAGQHWSLPPPALTRSLFHLLSCFQLHDHLSGCHYSSQRWARESRIAVSPKKSRKTCKSPSNFVPTLLLSSLLFPGQVAPAKPLFLPLYRACCALQFFKSLFPCLPWMVRLLKYVPKTWSLL